ncbi:MAG: transcription antitermination factor NusB [Alphaproteobacteria bacterium]
MSSYKKVTARGLSRLFALQALYQNEYIHQPIDRIIKEFINYRLYEKQYDILPNISFFKELTKGAYEKRVQSDLLIQKYLSKDWKLDRIPLIMSNILRLAVCELCFLKAPIPVVIDEYVEISKGFFEEKEVHFINGILDSIAKNKFQ